MQNVQTIGTQNLDEITKVAAECEEQLAIMEEISHTVQNLENIVRIRVVRQ